MFVVESRVSKMYVQDFLQENIHLIKRYLLDPQGGIYICGNLSMCNAVNTLIKTELSFGQLWTEEEVD